jgi:HPt (histidine-containing phosphotransfer) domain-containing protein
MLRSVHSSEERPIVTSNADNSFDWQAFVDRVGDAELARSMIEAFLAEDLPRLLGDLDAAVASGQAQGIREAAHGMKGAFAELRAEGARAAAARLEEIGAAGVLAAVGDAHGTLRREIDGLREVIASS